MRMNVILRKLMTTTIMDMKDQLSQASTGVCQAMSGSCCWTRRTFPQSLKLYNQAAKYYKKSEIANKHLNMYSKFKATMYEVALDDLPEWFASQVKKKG